MTDPTPYCVASDLLLGDLVLQDPTIRDTYILQAFDEINSRLGYIYTIPLVAQTDQVISPAALLVLKTINLKLASGRLIMAVGVGGEDSAVQAYGASLVQEAYAELQLVLGGQLPITGAQPAPGEDQSDKIPSIKNADAHSGVDAFESSFYGLHLGPRRPWQTGVWKPGP